MRRSTKSLQKIVASNIRRGRLALKVSQEEFADLCGYHRTYIGAIERAERNITLATLATIAAALGVEVQKLLENNG